MERLTLDVGCGNHPRGNVNVDLMVPQDIWEGHPTTCNPQKIKNFVKADCYHLPFKDNCFNKVVCHHTIEHLKKPLMAIQEMVRVTNGKVSIVFPIRFFEVAHAIIFNRKKLTWLKQHHHNLDCDKLRQTGKISKHSFWEYKLEIEKLE